MKIARALFPLIVAGVCLGTWLPVQAQGVRPEVGRPLQQASDLLRAGKAREALAKANEANAVAGKSAAEQLIVDRMRAAAAQRAGDMATAIAALESLHGRVGAGEQGAIAEQVASAYAQMRNNAQATAWVQRAKAAGHSSSTLRQLEQFLQGASGDYAAIARDAQAAVSAAEQAGRRPDEGDLLRLADAQQRTGNTNGYLNSLEKLLSYYPKKEYWNAYLARLTRKSGFSERFSLDVLRLRLAAGVMNKPDEYMELAQLAIQAGHPAEGRRVVERGFQAKVLGEGPEGDRHRRLRDLATKREADLKAAIEQNITEARAESSGNGLVQVGFQLVTMGQVDRGIELIEAGIKKGGLTRPADAQLRLGMALQQSPKAKARATATLRAIQGTDGVADIARLWNVVH
jgi:hypothetical protein